MLHQLEVLIIKWYKNRSHTIRTTIRVVVLTLFLIANAVAVEVALNGHVVKAYTLPELSGSECKAERGFSSNFVIRCRFSRKHLLQRLKSYPMELTPIKIPGKITRDTRKAAVAARKALVYPSIPFFTLVLTSPAE
jgi:hypothetical protein